ncbi:MAG: SOS response-associated peptidase [Crocinitomicaceae bacterium]|nr:SOS response-associated peptidase [Crocinitomicaceae bacterium]
MCYDIKSQLESQLKHAKRYTPHLVPAILEDLKPYLEDWELDWHHTSGFAHPHLLIYTNDVFPEPVIAQWGLIPHWTKDKKSAESFWNHTLNARSETITEKPSFRDSAKTRRCVIVVDGFFEHHHHQNKTYPFYISRKDEQPINLAGLWSEWVDKETGELLKTFTILTTKGNDLLSKIHNNPKLDEPRMPVILSDDQIEDWLNIQKDLSELKSLFTPFDPDLLHAHSVHKLRGKDSIGNIEKATELVEYAELDIPSEIESN